MAGLKQWISEHKALAATIGGALVALPLLYFYMKKKQAQQQPQIAPPSMNGGLPIGGGSGGGDNVVSSTPDPQTTAAIQQIQSALSTLSESMQTVQANMNAMPDSSTLQGLITNYNSMSAQYANLQQQLQQEQAALAAAMQQTPPPSTAPSIAPVINAVQHINDHQDRVTYGNGGSGVIDVSPDPNLHQSASSPGTYGGGSAPTPASPSEDIPSNATRIPNGNGATQAQINAAEGAKHLVTTRTGTYYW